MLYDISSVVGFLSVVLHFVLVMHLVSCHHSHCISIVFIKLASVRVPPVLSVVRSEPDTLARARGTSEILFYKWHKNVLGMGCNLSCGLIIV